jgi:spermidine synthase
VEIIRYTGLTKAATGQPLEIIECIEGVDASVAVLENRSDGSRQLNINGTSTAYTNLTDLQVHRLLAHIPMALHPDPREVLIIGFGFGSTAYGTLQYDSESVDCVELVDDERETAKYFLDQNHGVLEDPRFRFIAEDGRNFVLTTRKRYDVISLNAIHPALGPTLYTHDFFEMCRKKLAPDGLMCVWLPTTMLSTEEFRILVRSFQAVFPETSFWYNNPGNTIVLGGNNPFPVDYRRFRERLGRPGVKADLEPVNLADPLAFLSLLVMPPDAVADYAEGARLNTDDRPWIEFSRSMYAGFRTEMLEEIFFTVKADLAGMLDMTGLAEEERIAVERGLDRHRKAWPYVVEGHLLSLGLPSEEERSRALFCFHQALRFQPKDPQFRFLAENFGVKNPSDHAWRIRRLEDAIADGSTDLERERMILGRLYLDIGRFDKALSHLAPFEGFAEDGSLEFLLDLAFAYEGVGRPDRAVEALKAAASRYPDSAAPHARLVWPLLLRKNASSLEEALSHAKEAVRLEENAHHLDLLGVAYHENGMLAEAEDALGRAVEKAVIIVFVYKYHLAQVRREM